MEIWSVGAVKARGACPKALAKSLLGTNSASARPILHLFPRSITPNLFPRTTAKESKSTKRISRKAAKGGRLNGTTADEHRFTQMGLSPVERCLACEADWVVKRSKNCEAPKRLSRFHPQPHLRKSASICGWVVLPSPLCALGRRRLSIGLQGKND